MTNKQPDAQFDWATELLDAEGHVTLSEQEAHEIGARLRRLHSENETLQAGYAAARLEIDRIVPALEPVSEDFPAEWAVWKDRERIREELRASHGQAPAQAAPAAVAGPSEMHEAMCPALTGGRCTCERNDPAVDKAWARFCGGIGDGPDAPYPGMISAFERYYSQSFTDKDWRNEASVWAAAWKQALLTAAAPTPPAQAADSVLEDAARYRWLRERMLGIDFDWNESGITALSFEMPDGCAYGGCCNQNIDAAMNKGGAA